MSESRFGGWIKNNNKDQRCKQRSFKIKDCLIEESYRVLMNGGADNDDVDFTKLPLNERLTHKLWKARSDGYQELNRLFSNATQKQGKDDDSFMIYWKDPSRFGDYVTDSNVVAQEQAILALECLLKNVGLPKQIDVKTVMYNWIPALAEKGLASSRAVTKNKAMECIILICSFDDSIAESVELVLPFFNKKLPKLVAASINCIRELLASFGFAKAPLNNLLPELLDPLVKLAGHADRNVRAQTIALIVEIYKANGRNKSLLNELLLTHLKPIQQNELEKLFDEADSNMSASRGSKRLFQWEKEQMELEKNRLQENQQTDKDGDTLMDLKLKAEEPALDIDPFEMLPAESILDKLPAGFHDRISSTKWKDRVEALQEFWDNTLSKVKKIKYERQEYTEILSLYAQIIQFDANVQAVTIVAQSIQKICEKLRFPGFSKNYVTIIFVPLLQRTKEKKPSVIEAIRGCLQSVCKLYNPLSSEDNNEDMLQEILEFMKHKNPQIRMETTELFSFILRELPVSKEVIDKNLQDEIIPTVIRIVNDTQPTIRNSGFGCFAQLLRIMGRSETFTNALEKLDSLKRKKIQELCAKLPESSSSPSLSAENLERGRVHSGRFDSRPSSSSSIPSKRVASSPLKKVSKAASPNVQKSRMLLTSQSLAMPRSMPGSPSTRTPNSISTGNGTKSPVQLQKLINEKQNWLKERQHLSNHINELTSTQNRINDENEMLREQLKNLQTEIHERGLQVRSKDLQLAKLQDRVEQLQAQAHAQSQQNNRLLQLERNQQQAPTSLSSDTASAISTNLGVRSVSSSSFEPLTERSKHLRTPSESSDDLPRRVDSLQLNHSLASSNNDIINEESWKRAAEVTSQLKARIERMRAKTKGISNNF